MKWSVHYKKESRGYFVAMLFVSAGFPFLLIWAALFIVAVC